MSKLKELETELLTEWTEARSGVKKEREQLPKGIIPEKFFGHVQRCSSVSKNIVFGEFELKRNLVINPGILNVDRDYYIESVKSSQAFEGSDSASSQESDADTQTIFAEITKEVGWEMGREMREENEAWDPVTETSIWQEEMQF